MRKVIFLVGLMLVFSAISVYGQENAIEQNQKADIVSKNQKKILYKQVIEATINDVEELLANNYPDPWGREQSAISILSKEGNDIIPHIQRFYDSENMRFRIFALVLLINIDTDESLSMVSRKFWEIYKKSSNIDKIYAGEQFSRYGTPHKIPGIDEYLEAKYIFRKFLESNSTYLDELYPKLINDNNGIAVMAAKYAWSKKGKDYKDKFYQFSKSDENEETFFTFIDELANIVWLENEEDYEEMKELKRDFKSKAIAISDDIDVNIHIFGEVIRYLSLGEPEWFAENWIELYKKHMNTIEWQSKKVSFAIGVSNNEKAKQKIKELKNITSEFDYESFKDLIKD